MTKTTNVAKFHIDIVININVNRMWYWATLIVFITTIKHYCVIACTCFRCFFRNPVFKQKFSVANFKILIESLKYNKILWLLFITLNHLNYSNKLFHYLRHLRKLNSILSWTVNWWSPCIFEVAFETIFGGIIYVQKSCYIFFMIFCRDIKAIIPEIL